MCSERRYRHSVAGELGSCAWARAYVATFHHVSGAKRAAKNDLVRKKKG